MGKNFVTNGVFSNGLTGWTVNRGHNIQGAGDSVLGNSVYLGAGSQDGNDTLSQTLRTIPNMSYTLTFYLSMENDPTLGMYFNCTCGDNEITIINPVSQDWIQYSFIFNANSRDTVLSFSSFNNPGVNRLADIVVIENYPCFKEGTKILTDNGYVPIEQLRNGDNVKTLLHDFKPIVMIGEKTIHHPASEERIKDQLYKCSPHQYPELIEDLVLTGCHSILEEEFKDGEREKTQEVLGRIFATDDKYRLPACVDERTTVYEVPGDYKIYHIALEHEDYYMNYGIYANGLLVESCSQRYMVEVSNMTLIK
jgi:hypothetical protein